MCWLGNDSVYYYDFFCMLERRRRMIILTRLYENAKQLVCWTQSNNHHSNILKNDLVFKKTIQFIKKHLDINIEFFEHIEHLKYVFTPSTSSKKSEGNV